MKRILRIVVASILFLSMASVRASGCADFIIITCRVDAVSQDGLAAISYDVILGIYTLVGEDDHYCYYS